MPAMAPLDMKISTKPVEAFEAQVAGLRQKLASGVIDKAGFETAFGAAKEGLLTALDKLEQVQEKQREMSQAAVEHEKKLHATRLDTLQGLLTAQHDAWAKANPALAVQESFAQKVSQINDLFKAQLITLAKRNELLAFVAQSTKTPAMEAAEKKQEEMKSRGDAMVQQFKTPFENFVDKVSEIRKLSQMKLIDKDTASRAFSAARDELSKSLEDSAGAFSKAIQPPAALEMGTQQAFAAFQQNKAGVEQVNELKKVNVNLANLVRRGVVLAAARL